MNGTLIVPMSVIVKIRPIPQSRTRDGSASFTLQNAGLTQSTPILIWPTVRYVFGHVCHVRYFVFQTVFD